MDDLFLNAGIVLLATVAFINYGRMVIGGLTLIAKKPIWAMFCLILGFSVFCYF